MIPLLNLKEVNAAVQPEIEYALQRVARSGWFILGPEVERFEKEWAEYCGVKHCIGTGNALDSLRLILMANEIGPGDEVIVPSNTYIATWLAVTLAGATVVPVEPDPVTFNIDPEKIEAAITNKTRAIIVVHLYGRCAAMEEIMWIAAEHELLVFEDAAQAHGAWCWVADGERQVRAGALADAAAFSFYPTKNLGALGDAGCITTNDDDMAKLVRRMRNYGGVGRLDHTMLGINSRMDEIQAAVLTAKLHYLHSMNAVRFQNACNYWTALKNHLNITRPVSGHVFHQFVVRHDTRNAFVQRAYHKGLELHVHYPVPPHMEGAYSFMGKPPGSYPIAELLASQVFSLPIGGDVNTAEVIEILKDCCA